MRFLTFCLCMFLSLQNIALLDAYFTQTIVYSGKEYGIREWVLDSEHLLHILSANNEHEILVFLFTNQMRGMTLHLFNLSICPAVTSKFSQSITSSLCKTSNRAFVWQVQDCRFIPLSSWNFSIYQIQKYPAGGGHAEQGLQSSWLLHGQHSCVCLGNFTFLIAH